MSLPTIPKSAAGGALEYEIITSYDIYNYEVAQKLKAKVPDATTFSWMKKLDGRMEAKRKTNRSLFYHYEDGEWFPGAATIAAKNTGTANQVTVTLSAGDHYDSGARSFPTLNMLAVFPDQSVGFVTAIDKDTPDAHTVTIYRQNTAQDVQTAAVVGGSVVFYSDEYEAGSTKNPGHIPNFEKFTHQIHTHRSDMEVEDFEMMNELEFAANGSRFLYVKALDDMRNRHALKEEFNMLITPEAVSVTGPQKSKPIRSTKDALIPKINAEGINLTYTGTIGQSDFESMELLLDKFYGDKENLVGMGINVEQGLRPWLTSFTEHSDKGIKFTGQDKQTIGIDFKSVKLGAYTFHFDTWRALSHPGTLGATGMPYRNMMIMIPLGEGKAYKDEAGSESYNKKYFQIAYQEIPGSTMSNEVRTWRTGGANVSNPTSDELVKGYHMVSYKTLVLSCLNKFAKFEKID